MNIISLSNYVVRQFSQQSPGGITPMKLQKLLYYIKVWTSIAVADNNLSAGKELVPANFEHWDYGPVNREIYDLYKQYGSSAISPEQLDESNVSDPEKELIDFILENYIEFDAFTLSVMTHMEDPWKETEKNNIISTNSIKSYYSKQYFAKNFRPFDLSSNPFYSLSSYSFIIDMTEKDAEEITKYPSYEKYKIALHAAKQEFNDKWLNLT